MNFAKLRVSALALASTAIAFLTILTCHNNGHTLIQQLVPQNQRYLSAIDPEDTVLPYSSDDILMTLPYVMNSHPQLLVWDGSNFSSYNVRRVSSKYLSYRNMYDIPLLILALRTNDPDRFVPGSPPFELLWSGDDSIGGQCINEKNDCPSNEFAPLVMFGSVPKNDSLMPSVKGFPNPYFSNCLYHYRVFGRRECKCHKVNDQLKYDDLKRQIFWRGSDFSNYLTDYRPSYRRLGVGIHSLFTASAMEQMTHDQIIARLFTNQHDIPPRWIGLSYTILTQQGHDELPWIDVRFASNGKFNHYLHSIFEQKGIRVTADPVDPYEMSQYRYQIDLAGGGGTTWDGTLTKLLMPGLLFHHETPFKDWFYDAMIPWVHYVPINTDLSNLWDQFIWAERNGGQDIAERATILGKHLLSEEYMKATYQKLYVDYLGKVVRAYNDHGQTWKDIQEKYEQGGYNLYKSVVCDDVFCRTEVEDNEYRQVSNIAYVQV